MATEGHQVRGRGVPPLCSFEREMAEEARPLTGQSWRLSTSKVTGVSGSKTKSPPRQVSFQPPPALVEPPDPQSQG